jgi:hypothetical protein
MPRNWESVIPRFLAMLSYCSIASLSKIMSRGAAVTHRPSATREGESTDRADGRWAHPEREGCLGEPREGQTTVCRSAELLGIAGKNILFRRLGAFSKSASRRGGSGRRGVASRNRAELGVAWGGGALELGFGHRVRAEREGEVAMSIEGGEWPWIIRRDTFSPGWWLQPRIKVWHLVLVRGCDRD